MNRNILGPVIVTGALLSGCGENGPSQEVLNKHVEALAYFGCDMEPADIKVSDLSERSLQQFGNKNVGLAVTTKEGIELGSQNSKSKLLQLVIHETAHYCTDQDNIRSYQDSPIELPGIGLLTGSEGFAPLIDYSQERKDTALEEGVTEWLSQAFSEYELHPSYLGVASLTEKIANYRSFTREQVAELHNNDDLLGMIGLMKAKLAEQVNGRDINDIFYLYSDAFMLNETPNDEEIKYILDFQNE